MKYTTIAVLSLQAGVLLGLTEAQAATRKTVLTAAPARKGWYTTTGPVQFKRGEVFLFDGDLPKHLAQAVDPAEGREAKSLAKAVKAKSEAQTREKADAEAAVKTAAEEEAAAEAEAAQAAGGPADNQG